MAEIWEKGTRRAEVHALVYPDVFSEYGVTEWEEINGDLSDSLHEGYPIAKRVRMFSSKQVARDYLVRRGFRRV
jgi:hypothetical protein